MLFYFFVALVLSFVGSLPFGMINMAVAYMAIQKGVKAGIWMGAGAALVEFFQVYIALKFTWLFAEGGVLGNVFHIVATLVFFIAGLTAQTSSNFMESLQNLSLVASKIKQITKKMFEFRFARS